MSTPQDAGLRLEIEKTSDPAGGNLTTVKCHGRLIAETGAEIKDAVKPLSPLGGRIVLDMADLNYLDSSGLGTLLGLKASAIKQGYCTLELVNVTPRIMELLRLTSLTQFFSN